MRRFLLALMGILFVLLLSPQILHAAGNVLVPKDPANGPAPLPNLGLGAPVSPAEPAPAPTVNPPAENQDPSTLTGLDLKESPAPEKTAHPSPPYNKPQDYSADLSDRIIHQPDMTEVFAEINKNLPKSLTISFSERSALGSNDLDTIASALNINRKDVSSSCTLSAQGMFHTDKGFFFISDGVAPKATVRYDGSIDEFQIKAKAACQTKARPPAPKTGVLVEIGGRYIVPLQQIDCGPPKDARSASLIVTYDGSGTSQCIFR